MKTRQLLKEIKGVFKPPIKEYYIGKWAYGTPYFYPWNFHETIISVRKLKLRTKEDRNNYIERYPHLKDDLRAKFSNIPMVRRRKDWTIKLFRNYYFIQYGWPISIKWVQLGWKWKYECYDKDTQVLTKNGWKYFKELNKSDLILCLNDKYEGEYCIPMDIISYHYKGKMYKLSSTNIDLLVTPNHRLFVAKGNKFGRYKNSIKKFEFEFCTPDKYFNKSKRFLKSFRWVGENIEYYEIPEYIYLKKIRRGDKKSTYVIHKQVFKIEPFLKFLGFFTAEGSADEKKGDISISACNDGTQKAYNERRDVERILNELGFKIKVSGEERTGVNYKIYNKPLAIWLVENCGKLAPNKKAPDFIKNLTPQLIKIYLEWLYKGDGHKTNTSYILSTVSKQLKDDTEELILKSGKTFKSYSTDNKHNKPTINGRIIQGNYITHHINWLNEKNEVNINNETIKTANNYKEEWIDYNDNVYCATVPYNKLFIKRNGRGVWCGNSVRYEWFPMFQINFFKWQFVIKWRSPDKNDDRYYEQILWWLKGSDKDLKKAEKTWGWTDMKGNSTWNKDYLL